MDVFVTLEDDYCTDGFCYFVEVTTPTFLSTIMENKKRAFLSPEYPCIIVSKLTDDIIRAAIESFKIETQVLKRIFFSTWVF
ncbi:MAG: hypothetical protein AB8B80_11865 [Marinicellaceae bacterium]